MVSPLYSEIFGLEVGLTYSLFIDIDGHRNVAIVRGVNRIHLEWYGAFKHPM